MSDGEKPEFTYKDIAKGEALLEYLRALDEVGPNQVPDNETANPNYSKVMRDKENNV